MQRVLVDCRLIDGTGREPLDDGALHVRDDRIAWAGRLSDLPRDAFSLPKEELAGCTIIPGLIDAHTHLCLNGREPLPAMARRNRDQIMLEAVATVQATLASGTTTVRDLGGIDHVEMSLRWAIEAGYIPGPRILAAGKFICISGGHGYMMGRQADGSEEVRKAAREQIRAGADVVKMMASGGNCTPGQDVQAPQLTMAEMAAGVHAAHALGRHTAAHCHGTAGIRNAILAGVDTIEHASYLDEETADLMVERGAAAVFTLSVCDARPEDMPLAGREENRRVRQALDRLTPRVRQSVDLARSKGVFLGAGGDAGGTLTPHDHRMAREISALVDHAFSPLEAITIATRNNARILRLDHELGTLESGKLADFVILGADPLDDIANLWRVERVYKAGTRWR